MQEVEQLREMSEFRVLAAVAEESRNREAAVQRKQRGERRRVDGRGQVRELGHLRKLTGEGRGGGGGVSFTPGKGQLCNDCVALLAGRKLE